MKKYRVLAGATAAAVLGIAGIRLLAGNETPEVSLYVLHAREERQTVVCSGVIESAETYSVYTPLSSKTEQVVAEAGKQVQEGDVLFTVDVEATVAAAVASGASGVTPDSVDAEVTAPISGVLTTLNVSQGRMTDVTKPCAVIASNEHLQVNITIKESHLKDIAVGQEVLVGGVAFLRQDYRGTVTYIAPSARQTGSAVSSGETVVDAVVELDDAQIDSSLRLGLSAQATVVVDDLPQALVVPYEYVQQSDSGQEYVYIEQDGTAVRRDIETGQELASGFVVTAGLCEGDRIVTAPALIPASGTKITVEEVF